MPVEIHPTVIQGQWDTGFCLDRHTISSTFIGYDEFGHAEFDTQRSELGELVYRLKYKADKTVLPEIAKTVATFLSSNGINIDVIVPMPPSRQRLFQPVIGIAQELGTILRVPVNVEALKKVKATSQMKDIGDLSQRTEALKEAFVVSMELEGKRVLLIDDLYQSGATMGVAGRALKEHGKVSELNVIAITRTRH